MFKCTIKIYILVDDWCLPEGVVCTGSKLMHWGKISLLNCKECSTIQNYFCI